MILVEWNGEGGVVGSCRRTLQSGCVYSEGIIHEDGFFCLKTGIYYWSQRGKACGAKGCSDIPLTFLK